MTPLDLFARVERRAKQTAATPARPPKKKKKSFTAKELRRREAEAREILKRDPVEGKRYRGKGAARPGTLGRSNSGIISLVENKLGRLNGIEQTVRQVRSDVLNSLRSYEVVCRKPGEGRPKKAAKKKPKKAAKSAVQKGTFTGGKTYKCKRCSFKTDVLEQFRDHSLRHARQAKK